MTDDTLQVRGGAGGITADYDDMLSTAAGLDAIAGQILDRIPDVEAVVRNPDVLASTVLSPGTAAEVAARVAGATVGPAGLVRNAAGMKATALSLRAAVTAYQAVDELQAAAIRTGHQVGAPLALGGLVTSGLGRGLYDLQTGDLDDLRALPGLIQDQGMDMLYADPWIVDGVVEDAPALMWGLAGVIGPGGTAALSAWTTRTEGVPFPPRNLTDATGDIVAVAGMFGYFQAGTSRVAATGAPGPVPAGVRAPTSLSDTMQGVSSLGRTPGTVRVFAVTDPDGSRRWVVEIPGTQEWSPKAGSNPVDLTNNLRLMAGQQTEQNDAVRQALRQAGVASGEPVMLAGHSQGGITAASLAADPATRQEFHITNVYTGGAPIAGFAIPDDVDVLSIEHTQDAVPRLDGEPNPDRPSWVTVGRDADGALNNQGEPVVDTGTSHDSGVYAGTAKLVDNSTDPSITAMRDRFQPFFADDPSRVTYQDYAMTRDRP